MPKKQDTNHMNHPAMQKGAQTRTFQSDSLVKKTSQVTKFPIQKKINDSTKSLTWGNKTTVYRVKNGQYSELPYQNKNSSAGGIK
jgi:hypothetical protein